MHSDENFDFHVLFVYQQPKAWNQKRMKQTSAILILQLATMEFFPKNNIEKEM